MSRPQILTALKIIGGVSVLAVIVGRVGTGPFLAGVRAVDAGAVVAAVALGVVTTTAAAWRWSLVACALGVPVPLGSAVPAYYRAQFLNTVLPGGVLGDVERGVRQGRDAGAVGRSLRAVAWERSIGQTVQVLVTVAAVLVLPSPSAVTAPILTVIMVGAAVGVVVTGRLRVVRTDLRGLRAGRVAGRLLLASLVVVTGHVATYLIAARAVGVTASVPQLVPLALVALVAMAVPLNLGGWGPREGVAAWSFAAVGLGAAPGVATATAYGVLVLAAGLPGAVVLAVGALRRGRTRAPVAATVPVGADRG